MDWKKNKLFLIILVLLIFFFIVINLFFRDTVEDETEYIKEVIVLSECIKNGQWFGDYSVGLHGFLLKIPAAIIYIFFGINIFLIRSINIIFSLASCILLYKILDNKKLNLHEYKLAGVILLISSFQFLITTPTFLKEPSLLFFVLLFIYEFLNKKRFWLLGLLLLLIFDAKEYVAFVLSPAIAIWLIISKQKNFIVHSLQMFIPTTIFVILMFTTSLIPLNPFVASIMKLTNNEQYQSRHFNLNYATVNLQLLEPSSTVSLSNIQISENILIIFFNICKIISLYIQKILYPKVFSLLSLPLIIIIPSLTTSIILSKKWYKMKKYDLILLPLIFWTYLIVYLSYTSVGRYLYPIFPIIYIFFLYFVKNNKTFSKPIRMTIISISGILTILNIFYDQGFLYIKALIYLCFYLGLLLISFDKFKKLSHLYIFCFCFVSFISTLIFFITQDQIANSIKWGIDKECQKIVKELPTDGKILINEFGWKQLPNIYFNETYNLAEWQWPLKDWVPKKKMLKTVGDQKIINNLWSTEEDLKKIVKLYNIKYLAFVESSLINNQFSRQGTVNFALGLDWLKIVKIKKFDNKYFYLFKIIENEETKLNDKNSLSFELNIKKDIGQNLGTIFEIKDEKNNIIAGAGFIGSHSYFIKDDNRSLQFFVKENNNLEVNKKTENLNTTSTRLMSAENKLWASAGLVESNEIPINWVYDTNINNFKKLGNEFSWVTTVNNKIMKFFPNKITYDEQEIINTKEKSIFYYSNGKIFAFLNTSNPKLIVCPWTYENKIVDINKCKYNNIPYPKTNPIAFGNLNNQILITLNNGIILKYLDDNQLLVINPGNENKGEQFYTILNYYDKLLIGEYPFGKIFSYDGKKLIKEENNILSSETSGRELQTLTIYRGDIYAGVWPWGSLWKTSNIKSEWSEIKRMFSQPSRYDFGIEPYRDIIQSNSKYKNIVINSWGQRISSLVPFRNSLFISTSNKTGERYSKVVDFVKNPKEYGAVWELKANTNISCPFIWKGKTNLNFKLYDHLILIYQDNTFICKTILNNNNHSLFQNEITIGDGIYGKFNGNIIKVIQ